VLVVPERIEFGRPFEALPAPFLNSFVVLCDDQRPAEVAESMVGGEFSVVAAS
jgi:hypothetical protein